MNIKEFNPLLDCYVYQNLIFTAQDASIQIANRLLNTEPNVTLYVSAPQRQRTVLRFDEIRYNFFQETYLNPVVENATISVSRKLLEKYLKLIFLVICKKNVLTQKNSYL